MNLKIITSQKCYISHFKGIPYRVLNNLISEIESSLKTKSNNFSFKKYDELTGDFKNFYFNFQNLIYTFRHRTQKRTKYKGLIDFIEKCHQREINHLLQIGNKPKLELHGWVNKDDFIADLYRTLIKYTNAHRNSDIVSDILLKYTNVDLTKTTIKKYLSVYYQDSEKGTIKFNSKDWFTDI